MTVYDDDYSFTPRQVNESVTLTLDEEQAIQLLKQQRDEHYATTGEALTPFVASVQTRTRLGELEFLILFMSPTNPDGKGIRYQCLRIVRHTPDDFLDYFSVAGELIDESARVSITTI